MLIEQLDHTGRPQVAKTQELSYYEQVSQVGTDAGTVALSSRHTISFCPQTAPTPSATEWL